MANLTLPETRKRLVWRRLSLVYWFTYWHSV